MDINGISTTYDFCVYGPRCDMFLVAGNLPDFRRVHCGGSLVGKQTVVCFFGNGTGSNKYIQPMEVVVFFGGNKLWFVFLVNNQMVNTSIWVPSGYD